MGWGGGSIDKINPLVSVKTEFFFIWSRQNKSETSLKLDLSHVQKTAYFKFTYDLLLIEVGVNILSCTFGIFPISLAIHHALLRAKESSYVFRGTAKTSNRIPLKLNISFLKKSSRFVRYCSLPRYIA